MTNVNLINLKKTYPGQPKPVLDNFSLSINAGEIVALLGPSGSGKSTLLKLITGIERPDHGNIQLDGVSILGMAPNKRGAVLMFQKAYLFPFLTVAENIGFGLKVQRASKETVRAEVARMLDLINLPGIQRRKPAQLSGGEQQRVALARALVTNPRLLLLDEPLSSLDTTVRLNLQGVIRNIQHELGITTILVTHDLGEAMAMSDRIALLLNGKIVALDDPERLFHRPPSLAAAQFMGVTTFFKGQQLAGQLETPLGVLKVPFEAGNSCQSIFAIRPEHIHIQKQKRENALPGKVADCVFRGEYIEYQVNINTITVQARMPMPAPMFSPGEPVQVYFPPERLFAVEG